MYNKGRCKKLADNSIQKESTGYEKKRIRLIAAAMGSFCLPAAVQIRRLMIMLQMPERESVQQTSGDGVGGCGSIRDGGNPKDEIKVGVLHLSDPAEGSGYTYTHDLGIQGMQQNLGLSDDQIVRKINVSDSDEDATKQAIQECIDEGCNIIFATSWGYMEATAEMAEKYPDVYFSHGTGYMSNGRNFNNYFGRIYQARYLKRYCGGNEYHDEQDRLCGCHG